MEESAGGKNKSFSGRSTSWVMCMYGLVCSRKEKIKMRNEKDWEEVSSKSALDRYVRSVQGQEVVRLMFRLRTASARLLEGNKICKMFRDEVCNM